MLTISFSNSYSVSYWGSITASVRATFSETYNQSENTTTLRLTNLEFKKNGSSTIGSIPVYGSISINGSTVCTINNTGGGKTSYVSLSGSGWCAASLSNVTVTPITVEHNQDGSKNVTVTFTAGSQSRFCAQYAWYHQTGTDPGTGHPIYSTTYVPFGVVTSSGTMALTTRPRVTLISATDANFGSPVTITLERFSSSFKHTVTADCAGQTATIMTLGDTYPTLTWTPAVADYAPYITSSMSALATITCYTYSGETLVGSSSATCTLSFTAASVQPSVSISHSDPQGFKATYGKYIKGKSKITVSLSPNLLYGASLASVLITANGETYNSSPITTDLVSSVNNTSITARIVDSRGQAATASVSIEIYDYNPPTISLFAAHRCDANGNPKNDGAWFNIDYGVSVAPLGGSNTKTLQPRYKRKSDSVYPSPNPDPIPLSSFTQTGTSVAYAAVVTSSYDVQLVLSDAFTSTTVTISLPTAETRMNWGADSNGQIGGIAIGKVSERPKTFEVASGWDVAIGGDTSISGDVSIGGALTIGGVSFVDIIYPVGSIYMSVSSTSPAALFGGTWSQISDTFLLAAGPTYPAGTTGGSATVTLDVTQIPAHKHTIKMITAALATGGNYARFTPSGTSESDCVTETGGGQPHNNMPPYISVYVWKRTA